MSDDVDIILELIEARIELAKDNCNEHTSQNTVGFGYDLGAHDELVYLRDEIKEKFNL